MSRPTRARWKTQVAGLAQVPALGGHRPGAAALVAGVHPVRRHEREPPPARAQHGLGGVGSPPRVGVDRARRLGGEAPEPARRTRRAAPDSGEVDLGARQDAAHQRHEQQQVDRREPDRRVDVEEAEPVEPRPEGRVVDQVGGDLVGVLRALGPDRAGHRGDRQEHEQEQRDPHGRELPPGPAQPADDAEGRQGRCAARRVRGRVRRLGEDVGEALGAVRGHVTPPARTGPRRPGRPAARRPTCPTRR